MKKFKVVFNEERTHHYEVKAETMAEAETKAKEVYYDYSEDDAEYTEKQLEQDVKLLEKGRPEANSLISCHEV